MSSATNVLLEAGGDIQTQFKAVHTQNLAHGIVREDTGTHLPCQDQEVTPDATTEGVGATEHFHFPPAGMFADEQKPPEGSSETSTFFRCSSEPISTS